MCKKIKYKRYLEALMTCACLYKTTITIVITENTILRPATTMMTTPIGELNLGFRTVRGAESDGAMYVPSKYIGGDDTLKTPEYEVPTARARPFW